MLTPLTAVSFSTATNIALLLNFSNRRLGCPQWYNSASSVKLLVAYLSLTEIFNDDGTFRQTVFFNTTGTAYIKTALRAARKADPHAKLYVSASYLFSDNRVTRMFSLAYRSTISTSKAAAQKLLLLLISSRSSGRKASPSTALAYSLTSSWARFPPRCSKTCSSLPPPAQRSR